MMTAEMIDVTAWALAGPEGWDCPVQVSPGVWDDIASEPAATGARLAEVLQTALASYRRAQRGWQGCHLFRVAMPTPLCSDGATYLLAITFPARTRVAVIALPGGR